VSQLFSSKHDISHTLMDASNLNVAR